MCAVHVVSPVPSYGLEEEVFVLHGGRTSLSSLWNMGGLLWQDPQRNWAATATNFRRGAAARREPMSSVEVSTEVELSAATLFTAALSRRAALARAFPTGQLVALGALPGSDRYHTAGLHVHVGVPQGEQARVYGNLAYALPVLALASASSPYFGAGSQGPLSRVASSFALGGLGPDPYERFQDLIVTRRLGTIELRVLDPVPDPERLWAILRALEQVVRWPGRWPWSREDYNLLRRDMLGGLTPCYAAAPRSCGRSAVSYPNGPSTPRPTGCGRIPKCPAGRAPAPTSTGCTAAACGKTSAPRTRRRRCGRVRRIARYYLPKLPYIVKKAYIENKKR